jgi:hypothetical protein
MVDRDVREIDGKQGSGGSVIQGKAVAPVAPKLIRCFYMEKGATAWCNSSATAFEAVAAR